MKLFRTHKPSPALVIACIALFVSLGGTSYAAIVLPSNSVGTAQLKNGAVTASKLAKGAVTNKSFAASGASSVAAAGGLVTFDGTTPTMQVSFDHLKAGTVSVTRQGIGIYDVAMPGINYYDLDDIAQVTLLDEGSAAVARTASIAGELQVRLYDTGGKLVDPGAGGFSFVV